MNRKRVTIYVAGLSVVLLVGAVLGATLYQLSIPMTAKLEMAYSLELRRADGTTVITSYDWGVFSESQQKMMYDEVVQLWNIGNTEVTVNITETRPIGWDQGWNVRVFNVDKTKTYYQNEAYSTFTIAIGGYEGLQIELREVTASGGVECSLTLCFDVIEA